MNGLKWGVVFLLVLVCLPFSASGQDLGAVGIEIPDSLAIWIPIVLAIVTTAASAISAAFPDSKLGAIAKIVNGLAPFLKEKAPDRTLRALAELGSVRLSLCEREMSVAALGGNSRALYVIGLYPDEYRKHLKGIDPDKTALTAMRRLEELREEYGDVPFRDSTMAEEIGRLLDDVHRKAGEIR